MIERIDWLLVGIFILTVFSGFQLKKFAQVMYLAMKKPLSQSEGFFKKEDEDDDLAERFGRAFFLSVIYGTFFIFGFLKVLSIFS